MAAMHKITPPSILPTKHLQQRANKRGIRHEAIELALEHGRVEGDKHILRRQDLHHLIGVADELRRMAVRALDKGGVVVVEAGGRLVTTYRPGSAYGVQSHG